MNLEIFLFSFNRGRFLKNCLSSIKECAPCVTVTIVDDNSSDPYTKKVLQDASNEFSVINPKEDQRQETQLGGLYQNMNFALEAAIDKGLRYVLFIQDDMQLVRKITDGDLNRIEQFFENRRDVIQYQPCFRRKNWPERYVESARLDKLSLTFLIPKGVEEGGFSAVGVFDVVRVKNMLGHFSAGEGANGSRCRDLGIRPGISTYPFMNWLPYPSSFRGKRRNLEHRFTEFLGGSGFHPIQIMSEETVERLFARDPTTLPFAEDWLIAPSAPRQDVWSTGGGKMNVRARSGFRLLLFEALVGVKGLFSRLRGWMR